MSFLHTPRAPITITAITIAVLGLVVASGPAPASAPAARARGGRVGEPVELGSRLREEIARRHAPELRFNAWYPDPWPSAMHRNEDFLPMSVDRFLEALEKREAVVAVERSEGARPARARRVPIAGGVDFVDGALRGYPRDMVGDPPGAAAIYADVYPDPDDAGTAFVEYWVFYAMDDGDARIARALKGIGGHRSDWEHIALRLSLDRATGATAIAGGLFYGHGHALFASPAEIEILQGTHPVVYVSQGKHASYPEPGEWRNYQRLEPLVEFDDVFHGNGVRIATWRGEVVDIARARKGRPAWLDWPGFWGPEERKVLGVTVSCSARGPWFHGESNDRFAGMTGTWSNAKATVRGLSCDRDRRFTAPRPAEMPVPALVR